MKKVIISILTVLVMTAMPMVQAENITADQARDAAAYYMRQNTTLARLTADQLVLAYQWNNDSLSVPSMYLFTVGEGFSASMGWIIMAASTSISPVVAYADDEVFDMQLVPPQMAWWLENHNELVCAVQNRDAEKPLGDSPDWLVLVNRQLKGNGPKANVILMKEKWDQGERDGEQWNMMCPVINDSVCPTGCVATAMAQICHYYKYPVRPVGSKSYYVSYWDRELGDRVMTISFNFADSADLDYSIMPNAGVPPMSSNYANRLEVSRLGYYLGMSVRMQYAPSGSGTQSSLVASAMKNHFKFQRGTLINRISNNDTSFIGKIRRDVMQGYPVYMSGSSSNGGGVHASGHAWVCDGYSTTDSNMFHMNWGWGGSGNKMFNLVSNTNMYAGGYNFNMNHAAIVGMIPPADSIVGIRPVDASVSLGRAYPNPASISVTLPYSTRQAADLNVYSIDGRLVKSQRVQAGEGQLTLRVDTMPSGIYVYRLGDAYGKFVVR